jgi:hypothetical protein
MGHIAALAAPSTRSTAAHRLCVPSRLAWLVATMGSITRRRVGGGRTSGSPTRGRCDSNHVWVQPGADDGEDEVAVAGVRVGCVLRSGDGTVGRRWWWCVVVASASPASSPAIPPTSPTAALLRHEPRLVQQRPKLLPQVGNLLQRAAGDERVATKGSLRAATARPAAHPLLPHPTTPQRECVSRDKARPGSEHRAGRPHGSEVRGCE